MRTPVFCSPWSLMACLLAAASAQSLAQDQPKVPAPPAEQAAVPATQPARAAESARTPTFRRMERPNHGRQFVAPELLKKADHSIERGFAFLKRNQGQQGGWMEPHGPAITALVAKAFAQSPEFGPKHEIVQAAAEFVLRFQQQDGGIYNPANGLANYETCTAIMFLVDLRAHDPKADAAVKKAVEFLRKIQWDEGEGISQDNPMWGGVRYDPDKKRPDLSNTQYFMEALSQAGVPADDPAMQRALLFVQRCQDLSQTNDQPWARGAVPKDHVEGGFIYNPMPEDNKTEYPEGSGIERPRTYGSMTYAGFKSMLYAGVTREDPRVRGALEWIGAHYTLDANPNMPEAQNEQGLYYYYQVFGAAFQALDAKLIPTRTRGQVNWREDLISAVTARQLEDGSWINRKDRWMEGEANYITAVSILALQSALN